MFLFDNRPLWTKCYVFLFLPPARFSKTAGGIVFGVRRRIRRLRCPRRLRGCFCFISRFFIKGSFLKLGMCNICKNNIAKMFLDFFKI